MDQQFGPCLVGTAIAQGNLRATLDAHVQVDTSFGLTIIATLTGDGISLQDSYLFFKNNGEITVVFTLDAIATLSYTSGNVKMINLDNFPGATFRVPGIVTIGPNMELYGRVDAQLTFAGHVEAKTTIAS
jgi:chitinase